MVPSAAPPMMEFLFLLKAFCAFSDINPLGTAKEAFSQGIQGWKEAIFGESENPDEEINKLKTKIKETMPSAIMGSAGGALVGAASTGSSLFGPFPPPNIFLNDVTIPSFPRTRWWCYCWIWCNIPCKIRSIQRLLTNNSTTNRTSD